MKEKNDTQMLIPINIDVKQECVICWQIKKKNDIDFKEMRSTEKKVVKIPLNLKIKSPQIKKIIFQYKVSRCGSTLLRNMLSCDEQWKVISEPIVFTKIMQTKCNKKKYMKKVIEIFSMTDGSHSYCYFDFNSQLEFHRKKISKLFPDIASFYLFRKPLEVAESLNQNPPRWMSTYKTPFEYLKKVCNSVKEIKVHYYRNILSMHLIDWLYKKVNAKLSYAMYCKMKEQILYYSKNKTNEYEIPDEPKLSDVSGEYKKYLYNNNFIDFYISNPPYAYLDAGSNTIEKINYKENPSVVNQKLKDGNRPVLISNFEMPHESLFLRGGVRGKMWGLQAHKENYFIYHPKSAALRSDYTVFSNWINVDYEEWKKLKDVYLLTNQPVDFSSDPIFNSFNKNESKKSTGEHRISHKGAITCEHYDEFDTLLYVGAGKKKMYLINPSATEKLGIYPTQHLLHRRVIPNLVYLDTYINNIDKEKVLSAEINKGDVIYFPAGWCHLTITEKSDTQSINFRRKPKSKIKIKQMEELHDLYKIEKSMHPYLVKGEKRE